MVVHDVLHTLMQRMQARNAAHGMVANLPV
jgi:hypothetical protein